MAKKILLWSITALLMAGTGCSKEDEPNGDDKTGGIGNNEQSGGKDTDHAGDDSGTTGNVGYIGDEIDLFSNLSYDELVYVEGGTFFMGAQKSDPNAPNYDSDAYSNESPVHEVTLNSYYIGRYEVTQGLWEYVMNYSGKVSDGTTLSPVGPYFGDYEPSAYYGLGDDYPVYYVSYNDIVNYFLPRLNKITGKNFRLPTEAEWEYAARGGQKDEYTRTKGRSGTCYIYAGSNTIDNVAWYSGNFNVGGTSIHPVGSKAPNALGLYDMSGNLQEWCSDWYDSSYYSDNLSTNPTGPATGSRRVLRSGCWYSPDTFYCRVSYRYSITSDERYYGYGLRLAL